MAVLFDLDGTLIDTAPDFEYALTLICEEYGINKIHPSKIQAAINVGSINIVADGLGIEADNPKFKELYKKFLDIYEQHAGMNAVLFSGIENLLGLLDRTEIPWGIVTNKQQRFAIPLLEQLDLLHKTKVLVCGDTLSYSKPHPAPLIHACEKLNSNPKKSVYIGDAERDVLAGKAASMQTIVAMYGYIPDEATALKWKANFYVKKVSEIWPWIQKNLLH